MSAKPPVQFELPIAYGLIDETPYVPPVSHDSEVAEARRVFPEGTLVLAQQRTGACLAQLFIAKMVEGLPEDTIRFGSKLITAALIGSAQYSFAPGKPVMRRHLPLPILIDPDTGRRTTAAERADLTKEAFSQVTQGSTAVWREKALLERVSERTSHAFGRAAGTAALWLALLPHASLGETGTALGVQRQVRQVGMDALKSTAQLEAAVGARLSLAMLGGPVTNLSAYIERHAPDTAYQALRDARAEAQEMLGMQAA